MEELQVYSNESYTFASLFVKVFIAIGSDILLG